MKSSLHDPSVMEQKEAATSTATRSTEKNYNDKDQLLEIANQIEELMAKRAEYRKNQQWDLADEIRNRLEKEPYNVEITDYCGDKPSTWKPKSTRRTHSTVIKWTSLEGVTIDDMNNVDGTTKNGAAVLLEEEIPIVVAIVDTPHYRARLVDTRKYLMQHGFKPIPNMLLDLEKNPSLTSKRIVSEGWRTILLPKLLETRGSTEDQAEVINCIKDCQFVLVAEDDVRIGQGVCAKRILDDCASVWDAYPDMDVLSLGHSWADLRKTQQQQDKDKGERKPHIYSSTPAPLLLNHLQHGGGVHGATLLAVNYPLGVERLKRALDAVPRRNQTHLDQFLFLGKHNLKVAMCDPPLVGWSEVETTLTSSASGHRRQGGGRGEFVPKVGTNKVQWVTRRSAEYDETGDTDKKSGKT